MPGRRKLAAFEAHVQENGGDDWVFEFVAEGLSMKKVAEKVGASSRGMLYLWIGKDEERQAKLRKARELSAHSVAEDAGEILDDLAEEDHITSADVSLATGRVKYRQWLAEMRNRTEFGSSAGVQVNVSVGDLHLDALRRHSAAAIAARVEEPVEDAEYEIEEESSELGDELAGLLG